MKNPIQALYDLQQIEVEIINGQKRLKEINDLLDDDEAVASARANLEKAEHAIAPVRAKIRDLELEIQTNSDKIKDTDERLYSGSVTNTKAMQDMQQEIESLKRRNSTLEDQLLEQMMVMEEKSDAFEDAKQALADAMQDAQTEHGALIEESQQLQERVETLKAERQEALKAVDPSHYETYKQLRPRKANRPVALLLDGQSCSVCGVQQNAESARQARKRDHLVFCGSCERILFFKV